MDGPDKKTVDKIGPIWRELWGGVWHTTRPDRFLSILDAGAGIADMRDRMLTGRLKVFDHCTEWTEEFRQYHRRDGRIVKARDDLMDATRYGLMMLRHARVVKDGKIRRRRPSVARDVEYDVFDFDHYHP